MADSQPPEGLQPTIARAISLYDWENGISSNPEIGRHHLGEANRVIAAIENAGFRLLPSGGEVKIQYGVRWHATPGYGDEWDDWGFSDEAQAREEIASSPTPATLLRRRTITLPVEPVLSDNSEVPNG